MILQNGTRVSLFTPSAIGTPERAFLHSASRLTPALNKCGALSSSVGPTGSVDILGSSSSSDFSFFVLRDIQPTIPSIRADRLNTLSGRRHPHLSPSKLVPIACLDDSCERIPVLQQTAF